MAKLTRPMCINGRDPAEEHEPDEVEQVLVREQVRERLDHGQPAEPRVEDTDGPVLHRALSTRGSRARYR